MHKIIIGLFSPLNVDLTATYNLLRTLGEVRLIVAGQTNLGAIDILVVPDGVGIIPTIGGLAHNGRIFIPSKPINPHYYLWLSENPIEKLIDEEERGIPVLGIGDGAVMLYDILGGSIVIDAKGEASLLPMGEEFIDIHRKDGDIILSFSKDKIFGAMTLGSAFALLRELHRKIVSIRDAPTEDNDLQEDEPEDPTPTKFLPPQRKPI